MNAVELFIGHLGYGSFEIGTDLFDHERVAFTYLGFGMLIQKSYPSTIDIKINSAEQFLGCSHDCTNAAPVCYIYRHCDSLVFSFGSNLFADIGGVLCGLGVNIGKADASSTSLCEGIASLTSDATAFAGQSR